MRRLIWIGLLVTLGACSGSPTAPQAPIQITVATLSASHQAVAGVAVTLTPPGTTQLTNAEGQTTFAAVAGQRVTITIADSFPTIGHSVTETPRMSSTLTFIASAS